MQALFHLPLLLTALVLPAAYARMLPGDDKPETRLVAIAGSTYHDDNYTDLSSVDIISLTNNNSHTDGASAPSARAAFATVQVNNTVYIVGGNGGDGLRSDFWAYDISANSWTTVGELPNVPVATEGSTVAYLDGQIFFFGGDSKNETEQFPSYSFDMKSRRWKQVTPPIGANSDPCSVVQQNRLWYATSSNLYRSEDDAKTWTIMATSAINHNKACCVAVGTDGILKAGGVYYEDPSDAVEMYNVTTDKWTKLTSLTMARRNPSAVHLPDTNQVVVCGGFDFNLTVLASCEVYDVDTNVWEAASFSLKEPRAGFGLYVTQV